MASIIRALDTYTEVSPSGKGVKLLLKAKLPERCTKVNHKVGIEVYEGGRYFTLTGHRIEGAPASINQRQEQVEWLLQAFVAGTTNKLRAPHESNGRGDDEDLARLALNALHPSRAEGYWDWLQVGMALHSISSALLNDWDRWSAQSEKYVEGECACKWRSFSSGKIGAGTLFHFAKQDGWTPPQPRDSRQVAVAIDTQKPPTPLDLVNSRPMPAGMMDGWLGEMIEAVAQATETPRELPALMGIGVLATACQKRFSIMPESGYFEPLNLWVVCALQSGARKSAVVEKMSDPLIAWESEQAAALEGEIRRAEADRGIVEARIKALSHKAARATPEKLAALRREMAELQDELPTIPTVPRLFTDDVTPEHLGTMLAEHGEKMAILSDEGGIFDLMAGRYSKGVPNLDVWLKGHSGSSVRVDRGSRSSVCLHHPAVSIAISPQPDVLHGLAAHPGFRGRGLLARFLYGLPASKVGYRKLKSCPVPGHLGHAYGNAIKTILNTPPAISATGKPHPHVLRLNPEAWQIWKDHAHVVEQAMRPGGRFEHLTDWAGKLPGAVARLAGVLHVATYATERPEAVNVRIETMEVAIALAEILEDHALLVFNLMGADPAMDDARKLLAWINRDQAEQFTKRDCWHDLRGKFKKVNDILPALDILLETEHIVPIQSPRSGPGPKGEWFQVHPAIVQGWAANAIAEIDDQDDQNGQSIECEGASQPGSGHLGQLGHTAPDDNKGWL